MMSRYNEYKKNISSILFFFTLLSISGCSSIKMMIDTKANSTRYKKQIKEPTAHKYQLNIKGINRHYFLIKNNKDNADDSINNHHLVLVLAGSGCLDEQPLLGHLYKDIPVNADFVVLQKREVLKGSNSLERHKSKCQKPFYMHNNHVNRTQDNLFLIQHLIKKTSYNRISLLGTSEGVQIAYLMMIKNPDLNEAVLLANHASRTIMGAYDVQASFLDKTYKGALKRYANLYRALKHNKKDNQYIYGNYVKSWRKTFNSDKRNMGQYLSMKKNNRYLFIMGDTDRLVPSVELKETKKIFCNNKHNNNLMLYKKKSDHNVLILPRFGIQKIIGNWLDNKPYQESKSFTRLSCD